MAAWTAGGNVTAYNGTYVADNSGGVIVAARICQRYDGQGVSSWLSGPSLPSGAGVPEAAPDGTGGAVMALPFGSTFNAPTDVYAGRVSSSGAVQWGSSGVLVCNATGSQNGVVICGDGSGGAFIAWQDPRAGLDDVYVQHISSAGAPQWTANGVAVCTQPGKQRDISIVSDGTGGVILAWGDPRIDESNVDIYAQRVDASGSPQWGADGAPVCTQSGFQGVPILAADGSGGAVVSWWDYRNGPRDVYAQRLNAAGSPLWTVDGIPVANGPAEEYLTVIQADGTGGAFLAWEDYRSGSPGDIYAQHVSSAGSMLWTPGGAAVCTESHAQHYPRIVTDGAGGVVISWADSRLGLAWEGRAQRMNSAGVPQWQTNGVYVGSAGNALGSVGDNKKFVSDGAGGAYIGVYANTGSASSYLYRVYSDGYQGWALNYRVSITDVIDEPADEGGWVQIHFDRASGELGASPTLTDYSIWRRAALSPNSAPDAPTGPAFPPGTWAYVGDLPPMQSSSYAYEAPTHADSTASGPADDVYVIVTHTSSTGLYVVSYPDSGHSVDNLAPMTPQNVAGTLTAPSTVELHWSPNGERDLLSYSVYKGSSPGFTPSAGNRLGSPTSPMWTDAAFDASSYYKISAIDRHGNQSGYALIAPAQVTAVGPVEIPAVSFVRPPQPNPARSHVALTYGLSRPGRVQMDILDVNGRLVRRMLDGVDQAGTRSITWEGVDDAGRTAAAGIYWVHFIAPETSRTVRLVWLP
jgi:hypothetical protein